jgi:RNA polymerase sigma factor (sigma-70 family)
MNFTIKHKTGIDETLLWKAFKAGNEHAFGEIYQNYIQALINYGYKITSNRQLIQDAIQDLFVELWNSRQRLSETDSIKFYLFRALRNKLTRLLQHEHFDSIDDTYELLFEQSFEYQMLENETQVQHIEQLKTAISQLTKRQQEAINLRYFHDFSNEEIAQMMDLNYQSACKLLYSSLKFLKENIKYSIFLPFIFNWF